MTVQRFGDLAIDPATVVAVNNGPDGCELLFYRESPVGIWRHPAGNQRAEEQSRRAAETFSMGQSKAVIVVPVIPGEDVADLYGVEYYPGERGEWTITERSADALLEHFEPTARPEPPPASPAIEVAPPVEVETAPSPSAEPVAPTATTA